LLLLSIGCTDSSQTAARPSVRSTPPPSVATASPSPTTSATPSPSPAPTPTEAPVAPPQAPAQGPAAPPPAPAAAAGCYPLSNSGTCYQPGQFCRASDHGRTGRTADGRAIVCTNNNG